MSVQRKTGSAQWLHAYAIRYRNAQFFGERVMPVHISSSAGTRFIAKEATEAIEPAISGNVLDEPAPSVEPGVEEIPFECGPRVLSDLLN
jgi:hypothetical protein